VTEPSNPWLSKPVEQEAAAPTMMASPITPLLGPTRPQLGVPVPDQVDRLPQITQSRAAALWCLGVHGGAGESSVAGLAGDWAAAGHAWPRLASGQRAAVLLVARSNMRGLTAARSAATEWASGLVPNVDVVGLVMVADAPGRLPRPLREVAQVVAGGVPRSWRLPWIESWRLGEQLPDVPREARRFVDELHAVVPGVHTGGTANRKELS